MRTGRFSTRGRLERRSWAPKGVAAWLDPSPAQVVRLGRWVRVGGPRQGDMGRFVQVLHLGCVPVPRSAVVRSGAQRARIPRGARAGPRAGTMEWHSREDAPPGIESECIWKLECSKLWTTGFAAFQVSCKSEHKRRRSVFPNLKRIHTTQTYPYIYSL